MEANNAAITLSVTNGHLEEGYYSPDAVDGWMKLMELRMPVSSQPHLLKAVGRMLLGRFADRRYWLTSNISWVPEKNSPPELKEVVVPAGFVTDFASVPSAFWSILPPDGLWAYSAVIHDYLYWDQSTTRSEADEILDACMKSFGVSDFKRFSINTAVKLAGWSAWKENKELKEKGEKRVLKIFPGDPTVTWEEWKLQPDVFV